MRTNLPTPAYVFCILVYCLSCHIPVLAQQENTLEYKRANFFSGRRYFLNEEKISKKNVANLLEKESPEAYTVFKSARTFATVAVITYLPSIVLFIYGGGVYLLSGFDDGEELFIAGVAGTACTIIFATIANSKFKKAALLYNDRNRSTGRMNLNFGLTRSGGVGLTLTL